MLRELAIPFDLVLVDNQAKTTAEGEDFLQINPKGYVAALKLDNGQVLTEASAILQYLADLKPTANLAPANGSWERVRLQEWLNFIATEVHGGLAVFFNGVIQGEVRAMFQATLFKRFAVLVQTLERQDYLLGRSTQWRMRTCSWCYAGRPSTRLICANGRRWRRLSSGWVNDQP